MASMWQRAMHYLGLGPDDAYDDEYDDDEYGDDPYDEYDLTDDHRVASARQLPPEPPDVPSGTVRALPREPDMAAAAVAAAPAARARGAAVVRPLAPQTTSAKPVTQAPTSFNDAQAIADAFLDGTPVILNLQDVDRDLSRRLVDFASGLCYGLRGHMERVTHQVYLLTPANVEVSAEERRRLQERTS